jgi:hypothetical protein
VVFRYPSPSKATTSKFTSVRKKFEQAWEHMRKTLKLSKLTKMYLSFGEIDYYDGMVDMYETPTLLLEKGKRVAKIGSNDHSSIPKDWEANLSLTFSGIKQKAQILAAIKYLTAGKLQEKEMKKLDKVNDVLSGKVRSVNASNEF